MSSSQAGPSPAVTCSGSCERTVLVGPTEYVMRQRWAPHSRGLQLTTTLMDPRKKGGVGPTIFAYPVATEAALSFMASQKAEEIVKGKRDAHEQAGRKSGTARCTWPTTRRPSGKETAMESA